MKVFKSTILFVALLLSVQTTAMASAPMGRDKALDLFKQYVNTMVQRVEKAKNPEEKRKILNATFDNMLSTFDKVNGMFFVSQKDKEALATLRANINEKKNELNGANGYEQVPDAKLDKFAHYVQQDLEQADTVTISISATLLVLIIILLLLL